MSIFEGQIRPYPPRYKEILLIGEDTIINRDVIRAQNNKEIKLKVREFNSEQYIYNEISEADEVFLSRTLDKNTKLGIIKHCLFKGKPINIYPELFEIAVFKSQIEQINNVPLLKITGLKISRLQRLLKGMLDFLTALILILAASPIILVMSGLIKIYDGGPVIFRQKRVTRGGKEFTLYKLRTMVLDAEKETGPIIASQNDSRITPIGRFLRSSKIDELPQLLNVLKGEMSIVGPRPERPELIYRYAQDCPEFQYRTLVKAGITGLAQVYGKYDTAPLDKVKYDLYYIRNYSLFLDIKLILMTAKMLFYRKKDNTKSLQESIGSAVQ